MIRATVTCQRCGRTFFRKLGKVHAFSKPPDHLEPSTGEFCGGALHVCQEAVWIQKQDRQLLCSILRSNKP